MKLENTEDFLRKFDYHYEQHDSELIVDMNFSLKVSINFANPKQVEIKNKLIGWNFLTGFFPSSIKNAVLLNLIGGIILSLIISLYDIKAGVFFL